MLRFGAFWRRIRFPSVPNPAEVPSAFSTTHFMLVTLYLVPRETSSDLTFGVDGDKPLKRERLHFAFKSQKLKGLLVLDLSIVEDLKESKRNISVKFLSA